MAKTITMYARVAFDYRGKSLRPGQSFEPFSAVEAAALKTQKKADFRKPAGPTQTPAPVPHPVPVAAMTASRGLETSTLEADRDDEQHDQSQPVDATPRANGRPPRGSYRRQDMRADK